MFISIFCFKQKFDQLSTVNMKNEKQQSFVEKNRREQKKKIYQPKSTYQLY
jgi:hypothetical protein